MIDSAFAWIGQLADWCGRLIPRVDIVRATHGWVKFVRGSQVKAGGPGLVIHWPIITDFVSFPIARQADELRGQTLVTRDDKTIIVAGLLVYEVADIEALVGRTYDPQQAVKDLTLTAVHDVCCRMSWLELLDEQRRGTLDTKLKNEARRALDAYGVSVLKVMLTDLSPVRVLKLVQTMARGEE